MEFLTREMYGTEIQVRSTDLYINVTALSKAYEVATGKIKLPGDWLRLEKTKEDIKHLETLESNMGKPVFKAVQVFQGAPENGGGTFIHPRLGLRFAMWLSSEFGYAVEQWFQQWHKSQSQPEVREMSQLEMLQIVIERALVVERQQKELDLRLGKLEAEKKAALEELRNIPKSQLEAEKISTRSLINKLVREYVDAHGISYSKVWQELYRDFYYIYHYDARKRANNQKTKPLDQLEKDGKLEEFYAMVYEKFNATQGAMANLSYVR